MSIIEEQATTTITEDKYYLNKINEFKIEFDGGISKTFERRPLSSRNIKEIERVRTRGLSSSTTIISQFDVLFASYQLIARYGLGISDGNEFDSAIWEDDPELIEKHKVYGLRSVLDAILLRSINGIAYYSPELEEWLMYESPKSALRLTSEVIEAWNMWINKHHGIMPNQYHHFYEQGNTLIYPEHIADLLTIDKMWNNKMKSEQHKAEQKSKSNPLLQNAMKKGLGHGNISNTEGGFYGKTIKFK